MTFLHQTRSKMLFFLSCPIDHEMKLTTRKPTKQAFLSIQVFCLVSCTALVREEEPARGRVAVRRIRLTGTVGTQHRFKSKFYPSQRSLMLKQKNAVSTSMVLLNKTVLSSFDFNAPIAMLLIQCTFCTVLAILSHFLGFTRLEPPSARLLSVMIPINAVFVGKNAFHPFILITLNRKKRGLDSIPSRFYLRLKHSCLILLFYFYYRHDRHVVPCVTRPRRRHGHCPEKPY